MTDIDDLTLEEPVKDYREFSKKAKIRLAIFVILWLISYLVCTISLFFWKWFILPAISFIILFLLIYFIALDCYKVKFRYVCLALFFIFLLETISFIIWLWFSRYLVIELVLFNVAIWTLLFLLNWQLNHRTGFSPVAYFNEWWFLITSLLTVFFCVLMVWKYTQIPFTCDDIEEFPVKIAETTVNPLKKTWNNFVSWFNGEEWKTVDDIELEKTWDYLFESEKVVNEEPVEKFFTDLRNTGWIEDFFTNARDTIKNETVGIKNQISKSTCESYLPLLQKTQKSGWIQIAWIFIGYLLLVWVFKILLWVVSIIWFILFMILRMFGVYKYEKRMVEKEVIV